MAASTIQFSAHISLAAKRRLDYLSRTTGRSRRDLIEDAIFHEARALEEIPEEFILPGRIVITAESARRVLDLIDHPPKATPSLRRALRQL